MRKSAITVSRACLAIRAEALATKPDAKAAIGMAIAYALEWAAGIPASDEHGQTCYDALDQQVVKGERLYRAVYGPTKGE